MQAKDEAVRILLAPMIVSRHLFQQDEYIKEADIGKSGGRNVEYKEAVTAVHIKKTQPPIRPIGPLFQEVK